MAELTTASARSYVPTRPMDLLRVAFGVIWAVDASFKWTAGFREGYLGDLTSAASGQPG
ncbi:MAG: hypothetical protein ACYDEY_07145 [Acidimicrobiales bacterium]